jgi:hypothetical protein
MGVLCDAEIFLGITVRETGKVTTFCTDPNGTHKVILHPGVWKILCNYYKVITRCGRIVCGLPITLTNTNHII